MRSRTLPALILVASLLSCSNAKAPPPTDAGADKSSGDVPLNDGQAPDLSVDLSPKDGLDTLASPDQSDAPGRTDQSPPPTPCQIACDVHAQCADTDNATCVMLCEQEQDPWCKASCVEGARDCEELKICLGTQEHSPGAPFSQGPYGAAIRDVADNFTLNTLKGPWNFQDNWTGTDSHVFLIYGEGYEFAELLWTSPVQYWLIGSPKNVHYFFLSYPDSQGQDNAQTNVTQMKDRVDSALTGFFPADACHWSRHIHYVTDQAWSVGGWIQNKLQIQGVFGFYIDRTQRIRQMGNLQIVGGQAGPQLSFVSYAPTFFNFEWDREQALKAEADAVTELTIFDEENFKNKTFTFDFPPASEMQGYDTLEFDLSQFCTGHSDQSCAEWDYKANLEVCARFNDPPDGQWEQSCQPEVPAQEASAEIMGTCSDGGPECAADTDCADGLTCDGYQAAKEAVPYVSADSRTCSCTGLDGAVQEKEQLCKSDGTGYQTCPCNDCAEIARWITTYSREGRWLMDASPFLGYFKDGGLQRLRFAGGNSLVVTLKARLSNRGKGYRSDELVYLYSGGGFNLSYNPKYDPKIIDIPSDVTRVEIVSFITGHGFGKDTQNCAEFCNHSHHFYVNEGEFVKDHPEAGAQLGCAAQVKDGVVPNQWGTWYLGRGGWCPGLDVKPFIADVTDAIVPGTAATIHYEGLFNGEDFDPVPLNSGQGFGGSIWLNSYLVLYR